MDAAERSGQLTEAEVQLVRALKARDREVRAHEQAHIAAGAGLVRGGATYTYQQGPDGRRYAVAGEVSIDTAPVPGDPAQTARKAEQIRRAALAPASPSAQDRAVAAQASAMAAQARADATREKQAEDTEHSGEAQDGEAQDIQETQGGVGGDVGDIQAIQDIHDSPDVTEEIKDIHGSPGATAAPVEAPIPGAPTSRALQAYLDVAENGQR